MTSLILRRHSLTAPEARLWGGFITRRYDNVLKVHSGDSPSESSRL
jgi:hypothetical protein